MCVDDVASNVRQGPHPREFATEKRETSAAAAEAGAAAAEAMASRLFTSVMAAPDEAASQGLTLVHFSS
jgi:hypothetical protein